MWKALKFTENLLDSIDQTAQSTLTGTPSSSQASSASKAASDPSFAPSSSTAVPHGALQLYSQIPAPETEPSDPLTRPSSSSHSDEPDATSLEIPATIVAESDNPSSLIASLREENRELQSRFDHSLEQKEREFTSVLSRLKQKDEMISVFQKEKEEFFEEYEREKKQLLTRIRLGQEEAKKSHSELIAANRNLMDLKSEHSQVLEDLRREREELENDSIAVQGKLSAQMEELDRMREMNRVREDQFLDRERESEQYRSRVQQIIKEKNKTISDLSGGGGSGGGGKPLDSDASSAVGGDSSLSLDDLEEDLQFELESARNELKDLTTRLELERRTRESEVASKLSIIRQLERKIGSREGLVSNLRQNLAALQVRLRESSVASEREKAKYNQALAQKEDEFTSLRRSLEARKDDGELERKIRLLSEHLLQTRSLLDTAESEKVALNLRLEKASNQIAQLTRDAQGDAGQSTSPNPFFQYDEDPRNRREPGDDETVIKIPMGILDESQKLSRIEEPNSCFGSFSRWLDSTWLVKTLTGNVLRRRVFRTIFVLYIILMHILLLYMAFRGIFGAGSPVAASSRYAAGRIPRHPSIQVEYS